MASDLLSIGASGAKAARAALDVTAQNIANASSTGYVRRSVQIEEVAAAGGLLRANDISLSGARIASLHRNADMFRQAEVRRTNSDVTRSASELEGLQNIETSLEQSGVYTSIVEFEASLQRLATDAVDSSLRAAALASADAMAAKFNIAASSIATAAEGLQFDATSDVDQANQVGRELARINLGLARAGAGSSDQAALLDRRDLLLEQLSGVADVSTTFAADGTVAVKLGGAAGATFVQGKDAATLTMTSAADGTIAFAVGGAALTLNGGSLAGAQAGLAATVEYRTQLDAVADSIAATVNTAQGNGADLTGATGTAMFSGSGAAGMALALTSGSQIAAAASGSAADSRDSTNLAVLRADLGTLDPAGGMNMLLFDVSSRVAARELTHEALETIASSAQVSLQEQAGVDLDTEAANLIRYQQAFQASSRAMQVATELFDTLVAIG